MFWRQRKHDEKEGKTKIESSVYYVFMCVYVEDKRVGEWDNDIKKENPKPMA
jgi:hypothetical protein